MAEYNYEAPAGNHSEAEEDNDDEEKTAPRGSSVMTEVSDPCNLYSRSFPLVLIIVMCCVFFSLRVCRGGGSIGLGSCLVADANVSYSVSL